MQDKRYELNQSSDERFVEYYSKQSLSIESKRRFVGVKNAVQRVAKKYGDRTISIEKYDVADIGCGAGSQCLLWASEGHRVHGIDINEKLLTIAEKRSDDAGINIEFHLGSAANLPWSDSSMDVCLVPELLEHVTDWERCLDEFARILRPSGILYISTTNKLCPYQNEFNLPLYSWYPNVLKAYFVKMATSSRPQIVNYATYPAVNWFTFFQLKRELNKRSFRCYDRFDVMDIQKFSKKRKIVARIVKANRISRLFGHIASPGTMIFSIKHSL